MAAFVSSSINSSPNDAIELKPSSSRTKAKAVKLLDDSSLFIDFTKLRLGPEIGSGNFATVYGT